MSTIAILGEGAWGTAVATLLAENKHTVLLWCHDKAVEETIKKKRYNDRYLPGIYLSELIIPVTNINEALQQSSWIFETTPVKFLRSVIMGIDSSCVQQKPWVILSKGIEKDTLLLPTQIVSELIGDCPQAVLFGPSFAQELAQRQITVATIATDDAQLAMGLQKLLANSYFRPYLLRDTLGVQLGGALKNVLALVVGMLLGAGYGDNAKAFIVTRGFHEMVMVAVACGAHKETLYGLSGIGDLILTAFGKFSRNTMVGTKLGQGQQLDAIIQQTGVIPESINTLESLQQLIKKKNLNAPILSGIHDVVFKNLALQDFIQQLMKMPVEFES